MFCKFHALACLFHFLYRALMAQKSAMKKLTREDMLNEPWRGKGGSSKVFRAIISLTVGEIILIEPTDWGTRKYPPSYIARYIAKKYKRKYVTLRHAGGKGWAVERVE